MYKIKKLSHDRWKTHTAQQPQDVISKSRSTGLSMRKNNWKRDRGGGEER
jgi:hypothetical protein